MTSHLDLTIRPAGRAWAERCRLPSGGDLLGHARSEWSAKTRREVGLPADVPVIATGHQTLLWHPGILVKYLLADAVARRHDLATANLIVDQHAAGAGGSGDFGAYEVPVRRADGSLAVRRIELTRPRAEVPMALHPAFAPAAPPEGLAAALPAVAAGVRLIHERVAAHRDAPNAAIQMGRALADLLRPWARPAPSVTAGDLLETSLARAMLAEMVRDPEACARAYNEAVASVPEAGIGPLLVRDDYVELPLWRIRDDGRRMHAYDDDAARWLEEGSAAPRLLPRALFMTSLIRLGMCDLFVHGLGGASYDRAMEAWIARWLGVEPAPIAVASANLRLPLGVADGPPDVPAAVATARRGWHDPESAAAGSGPSARMPGPVKSDLLAAVEQAPRGSRRRRTAFFAMHRELGILRSAHAGAVERLQRAASEARQRATDAAIAGRRDWPFPLYPVEMIDGLAAAVADVVNGKGDRSVFAPGRA